MVQLNITEGTPDCMHFWPVDDIKMQRKLILSVLALGYQAYVLIFIAKNG